MVNDDDAGTVLYFIVVYRLFYLLIMTILMNMHAHNCFRTVTCHKSLLEMSNSKNYYSWFAVISTFCSYCTDLILFQTHSFSINYTTSILPYWNWIMSWLYVANELASCFWLVVTWHQVMSTSSIAAKYQEEEEDIASFPLNFTFIKYIKRICLKNYIDVWNHELR